MWEVNLFCKHLQAYTFSLRSSDYKVSINAMCSDVECSELPVGGVRTADFVNCITGVIAITSCYQSLATVK